MGASSLACVVLQQSKGIAVVVVLTPFGHTCVCYAEHDGPNGHQLGSMSAASVGADNDTHGHGDQRGGARGGRGDNGGNSSAASGSFDGGGHSSAGTHSSSDHERRAGAGIGSGGDARKPFDARKPSWGRVGGGAPVGAVRNALRAWSRNAAVETTSERGGKRGVRAFVIPPLQVQAVDIIGAGDAAVGGLVTALALNLPLRHAMVWATCCGALSLLSSGAQDSMADRERLQVNSKEQRTVLCILHLVVVIIDWRPFLCVSLSSFMCLIVVVLSPS